MAGEAVVRVLIVDDQAPFRNAARTVVGLTPGFEVVGEASSGEEAVDLAGHVRLLYCHLFSSAVFSGEQVVAGQAIGTVGSSGLATGPHLHFEIQVEGRSVDPAKWLSAGS